MSYCVNCGVELGKGAKVCPLCNTPVINPNELETNPQQPFFPTRQEKIQPVSKRELALLLSVMFASVAVCCGLLNLALRPELMWSLYAVGAAAMLWIWFVPPLLWRKMPFLFKVFVNMCAVSLYVLLIAQASGGLYWYFKLALPLLFSAAVVCLVVCYFLKSNKRSLLSSFVIVLLGAGLLCGAVEFFVDRFLHQIWQPSWSLIVLAVCVGFCVPLIVIRCVPSLREEARRRFHL